MKGKILAINLLMYVTTLNVTAQESAVVKGFVQTTDHISRTDRRNDMNGTPCALVKVQVVDEIDRVEGNKIGDIINKGVEKWIYMCKGSRNIKIHLKKSLPITLFFRDYGINGLESNRVYEMIVETPYVSATQDQKELNAESEIPDINQPQDTELSEKKGKIIYMKDGSYIKCYCVGDNGTGVYITQDGYRLTMYILKKKIERIDFDNIK